METIKTKIVGVTFANSKDKIKQLEQDDLLFIKPEPSNEADKNAMQVINLDGEKLGYLNKELALNVKEAIDKGNIYYAQVLEVTGNEDQETGCNIELIRMKPEKEALTVPMKLRIMQSKEIALKNKIEVYKTRLAREESEIFNEVNNEKTEEGKSVYSNEKARKFEVDNRMFKSLECTDLKNKIQDTLYKYDTLRRDMEYLERILKSYWYILQKH